MVRRPGFSAPGIFFCFADQVHVQFQFWLPVSGL